MERTIGEINQIIREVVSEAKSTARVETGFLKRSIRGILIRKNNSVEFRQIFYGVYRDNSDLIRIAQKRMPKDISWKVISEDEEGREVNVKATTRTGRTISRKAITSENIFTSKIKALINLIRGKKKDSSAERN